MEFSEVSVIDLMSNHEVVRKQFSFQDSFNAAIAAAVLIGFLVLAVILFYIEAKSSQGYF